MRQLIRTYKITGDRQITISNYSFTKEDVRLIINESLASTDKLSSVLVSSTAKDNIISVNNGIITLSDKTASLKSTDILTIEIDVDNIAKESTVVTKTQEIQNTLNTVNNNVTSSKDILNGRLGDIFTKFGDLTTFIAQKFDWLSGFIVTKKDELQQFIIERKNELHNFIATDILGTINRNHGEILGKTNDILGRQQDYENNAVLRTQDVLNTVNSQGSQLGKHLDVLITKIDEIELPEIDTTELAKQGDNPEATNSKILNAIQSIVGTGLLVNEEVKVKVSIPNSEEFDWSGYSVILTDKSANTQEVKNLNADGTCTFNVPIGHSYEVGFPQLTAYAAPMKQTYVAIQRERYLVHEYAEPDGIEVLKITVMSQLSGGTSTILDGSVLSVTDTNGEVYSGVVNGYECHISIPYGKVYTLVQPFIEGYRSESGSATYTALAPIRNVTLRYSEDGYGVFGVDDDGKLYTIDEIEAMHDKTIIKYGFYNDLELASASRIDSGFGNGFYWELGKESLGSMQWAAKNVAFDTSRLPYFSNDAAASKATAGAYYTKVIEEVGPSVVADSANPTPAASACLSKTVYFGGKEHQGFLPAYGQIKKIATTNRTLFQAFYSALGRTAPVIWSGDWWTSCQYIASYAVSLYNGGFHSSLKTNSSQVFCCFDL